ncbi:uncharacterized protein LOC115319641 [Ixodes scapularis]|uniref:uncharacterized protein LOC115319641 n=1 Tax=Ixodes scapularis TaxID=6945 RepID=UPI001C3825A1|nr:uncharacterized protein LOC115319641 [Ixodes scapularis]
MSCRVLSIYTSLGLLCFTTQSGLCSLPSILYFTKASKAVGSDKEEKKSTKSQRRKIAQGSSLMPATMCCHDLLMRNATLSAYTPMCVRMLLGGTPAELLETPFSDLPCSINCRTTCGSAVDAGGAVGPYCLTLADEDTLAKNKIVDPSIGLEKREEW